MWSFYWYLTFVTWQVSLFARLTGCLCCQWAALLSVGVLAMRPGCICLMSIWLGDPLLQTPTDTNLQHLLPLEHACLCFWLPAVLCRPRPAQQCNYIHFLSSPLLSSPLLSSPLLSSPLLSSPLLSSPLLSSPLLSSPLSPIDPISLIVLIESQRRALLWFHY